jgi:preflagellin peptidase FlaK
MKVFGEVPGSFSRADHWRARFLRAHPIGPRIMDWLTVSKVVLAFALLLMASRADWRTREVSDVYWLFLGVAGMAFLAVQMYLDAADLSYYLILLPIAVVFLDIFWERKGMFEDGVNLVPLLLYVATFASLAWLVIEHYTELYLWNLMIIPVMFAIFIILYQFDIIKGGADAKALIALAIMFPVYPFIGSFPLIAPPTELSEFILPFPLLILFNAALVSLAVPIALLILNIARRDVNIPAMLFGYRMSLDRAEKSFVWPMERMVDGERRMEYFPRSSEEAGAQFQALRAAGVNEIWVTPKVPFLIPITISIPFSVIIGNLLFLIIG